MILPSPISHTSFLLAPSFITCKTECECKEGKPSPLPIPSNITTPLGFRFAMSETEDQVISTSSSTPTYIKLTKHRWLLFILLNIIFVAIGQTSAVLLIRFYYKQGGNSVLMATLVQSSGFPILFIPLILFPNNNNQSPSQSDTKPPRNHLLCIYTALGFLIAGNNLLYSIGLLYLSSSTYSLICTTQLAFNAVFSYFLNAHKLTPLTLNSVIVVTLSAALLAVNQGSDSPMGVSKLGYTVGFLCTLAASGLYPLLLSLIQFSFHKFLKKDSFFVVLQVQIWASVVATFLSVAGIFISGEWRGIGREMAGFKSGTNSYVMTLVWAAVCWQLCSVGVVGLIFLVSSLFSNVISSVALAIAPIASVVAFGDKMNGVKIIAMVQAFWGLGSYAYQQFLDDDRLSARSRQMDLVSGDGSRV